MVVEMARVAFVVISFSDLFGRMACNLYGKERQQP